MKNRKPAWTDFGLGEPVADGNGGVIFVNSRYQVHRRGPWKDEHFGLYSQLSIKRRDREPILDWRDMQKIKNIFFGSNATMIQIFPPERYLVDTSNQYWFYVLWEYEFPFGFKERLVSDATGVKMVAGGENKQRPFEEHQVPEDFEADKAHYQEEIKRLAHIFKP